MKRTLPPGLSQMKAKLNVMAASSRHLKKTKRKYQQLVSAARNLEEKDVVLHGRLARLCAEHNEVWNNYRHMHIAYCELNGKKRKQIETAPKMRKEKPLSEELIQKFKAEYSALN